MKGKQMDTCQIVQKAVENIAARRKETAEKEIIAKAESLLFEIEGLSGRLREKKQELLALKYEEPVIPEIPV